MAISSAFAEAPAGYYNSLKGKCGYALKKAAKDKVRDHTVISYGGGSGATWDCFRKTDVKIVNGKEYWWDMYSNDLVPVSGHDGLNIEHSVANSWWGGSKNDAYKDLFHLNPSNADANNRKANYPLGEIQGTPKWTNGVTNVGTPVSGQGGGNAWVYEPHDDYKGDFARVFMYMFTVYDDISWRSTTGWMYDTANTLMFKPWAVELLLRWNREDPVDEKERSRQEAIYGIQGNRNPFIDMPELAEYIWGEKNTTAFDPDNAGSNVDPNPNPNPNPNPTPNPVVGDLVLDQNFESTSIPAGWANVVSAGDLTGWFTKEYNSNTYASCSSYKGKPSGGPYEMWLITPAIEIPADSEAFLSFRTQGAYGVDESTMEVYQLSSQDPAAAEKSELTDAKVCVPNADGIKPVYCDWVASGETSLGVGAKTTFVGFRYYSAAGGSGHSATYCVDDVKVVLKKNGSSAADFILDLPIVAVEGDRIIAPAGSRIFDLNGHLCAAEGLSRGLYIVAVPGGKAVKVMVK
ncbi:MAG: endonuclease [Prevotella sp.]|nr:endonuclease [Prevotella sp.]MCM1475864.1 endonuclease [Muribaculaceae bacterium]